MNKYKHNPTENDVYIGRGSPFGNPFSHLNSTHNIYKVDTREEAIKSYRGYFNLVISGDDNKYLKNKLLELKEQSMVSDINLVCFCKPKACHGDVIKEWLETKP